jgi:hypothetical protein
MLVISLSLSVLSSAFLSRRYCLLFLLLLCSMVKLWVMASSQLRFETRTFELSLR